LGVNTERLLPQFKNEENRVFNLMGLKEPSVVERQADPRERDGLRDFLAAYRPPVVDGLVDPLKKLKAFLGSPGPFPSSRFSDGTFPAIYMGDSEEACLAEVSFHLTERLRETSAPVTKRHTFQLSLYTLTGETVDVRRGFPRLHLKSDWAPAQAFGALRFSGHAKGITFKSVRRKGAVNTAVFKAPLVALGISIKAVVLQWDGRGLKPL
jgi:hypothetical protein